MAVFTELTHSEVKQALLEFDLGDFVSLTPISGGIENTNYFLDTTRGHWVLTVFERLLPEQLPFYLQLTEHLKSKGCQVACPQRSKDGRLFKYIRNKPFAIANRLHGQNVECMTPAECRSMGKLLAKMHLAALDFPLYQKNLRDFSWCEQTAPSIQPYVPDSLYKKLQDELSHQRHVVHSPEYARLTVTACHCDLFRNNALIADHGTDMASVAGVFDFYFAGCSPWLFDLAVTVNDWCIDIETGKLDPIKTQAFLQSYHEQRPLNSVERSLWRDMLRAAALRFWTSRLYDFYLPRQASLLTPHDPTHFERVLDDRKTCDLFFPS